MKVKNIKGRQILDSRGNPTVEADVLLENNILGRASVPSGASTGTNEALELRDGDKTMYGGKSVLKAVNHIDEEISRAVVGMDVTDQKNIDGKMIEIDGTENKSNLGANAILAVSLACAHAAAKSENLPLYKYINNLFSPKQPLTLPLPMMNVINGGKHAAGSTDIQEFMVLPVGAPDFTSAVRMGAEIFHTLGTLLEDRGFQTTVGDEGGYAPHLNGNKDALDLISQAVEKAGYKIGDDVVFGIDVASSELYENGTYNLKTEKKKLSSEEMIVWYETLIKDYPIVSIEDGLSESDWDGWKKLYEKLGSKLQLVGDDLLVTNMKFLKKAVEEKAANSILIKLNQIGSLTETLEAVSYAKNSGWKTIISHRSGETEDTTIVHLAVGVNAGQIKTGSLSRTERTAKYNELMRIEEELGNVPYMYNVSFMQPL